MATPSPPKPGALPRAVPRGLALAWFVYGSRPVVFWTYTAVIGGDWAWSVTSTCVRRRIKDIPKAQLARDVTGIVLCYLAPLATSAAAEAWRLVRLFLAAACNSPPPPPSFQRHCTSAV